MVIHDFYSGFEGEPECRISLASDRGVEEELHVWSGYFDALMASLVTIDGQWRGVALHHHAHTGWNELGVRRWTDPDVVDSRRQLEVALMVLTDSRARDSKAREVGWLWVNLLQRAEAEPSLGVRVEYL
ncbi:MAG: hypothetical protein CMN30_07440 [Sandaracinus sp.]|nr:hypothetical protein [Sandaracinus sp.]|tara:strand:- start:1868 stop:2254 length:387 start_codon:yes stop_codon:yes gene_type:complete